MHRIIPMRTIPKDIILTIDGNPQNFRLRKPDTFSRCGDSAAAADRMIDRIE